MSVTLNSLDLPNSLDVRKPPAETRVVVAMSGGVDSSVVAALLHAEGYDVVGVTLQLYDHGDAVKRKGACCAGRDIHDARDVAAALGIPHYVLDYEARFREKVIAPFAQSYANGETPIPCVACNSHVKFADLLDTARELGADVLATGHYISSRADASGHRALHRAFEAERDQSYFLFSTTQAQLDFLRFPLGHRTKDEVRDLARVHGLTIADKADSQDICFVPNGRYTDVIAKLNPLAAQPGSIVHVDGRVLGTHAGIIHFTIGQRRGLGLGASAAQNGESLYVIRINAARAEVIVGPREALETHAVILREINWIGGGDFNDLPADGLPIAARMRSTRAPVEAKLYADGTHARVTFEGDAGGISPGQACVFYENTSAQARVLGGGFIASSEPGLSAPVIAAKRAPELTR